MKRVRNWTISHQYFVVPGGPNWTHSANHEGSDAGIECRHVCGELELRETRVGGRRELERGTGASAGRVLALNEWVGGRRSCVGAGREVRGRDVVRENRRKTVGGGPCASRRTGVRLEVSPTAPKAS